ncbi:MAG TPA: hypothetical protein ENI15_19160 [Spirochaetes bacterium]|nr:hypothetical protein [Spirochaetota bacterium]
MSWQDFPMIVCPHCLKEFQMDDYYDLSAGSTFYCGACDKEIHVWAVDTTLSGDIQAEAEPEPA